MHISSLFQMLPPLTPPSSSSFPSLSTHKKKETRHAFFFLLPPFFGPPTTFSPEFPLALKPPLPSTYKEEGTEVLTVSSYN